MPAIKGTGMLTTYIDQAQHRRGARNLAVALW